MSSRVNVIVVMFLFLFSISFSACSNQSQNESTEASTHESSESETVSQSFFSEESSSIVSESISEYIQDNSESPSESGVSVSESESSAPEEKNNVPINSASTTDLADLPIASMSVTKISGIDITFNITNNSEYEATTGAGIAKFEYLEGTEWKKNLVNDKYMTPSVGIVISPSSTKEFTIQIDGYEIYDVGREYKITKEIDINKETIVLTCNFKYQ